MTLEEALDIAEQRAYEKRTPAFPPVADTIAWFNSVDWADVRQRCRAGFNNCGLLSQLLVKNATIWAFGCLESKNEYLRAHRTSRIRYV